ncbi:MAG TPA: hypothetical protein VMH80_00060 [Bryobacteraceae bacterium]|nr:hypothetical protein [Bryobacteraceae bacterium]
MPRLLASVLLCVVLPWPQNANTYRKRTPEDDACERDPQLCLWKNIKKALIGPNGAEYFETSMKGALLPPLQGKVVRLDPVVAPRIIVLAVEDGTTPDATLKFDKRLPGKVKAGAELIFEGVPQSYTTSPFMVVFDVDRDHLQGWPKANR